MSELTRHPKQGMYFNDARRRAVRIAKNDRIEKVSQERLVNSLCNQIRLHDGERAVKEVQKEILMDTNNHSSNMLRSKLGYSSRYETNYERIFSKN